MSTVAIVDLDSDTLDTVSSLTGLVLSLVSLLVALIALRFGREQARSYLFPVPHVALDRASRAITLRNIGGGAMVNIRLDLTLLQPGADAVPLSRHIPTLVQGESAAVVESAILDRLALARVEATLEFENVRGRAMKRTTVLTAEQLVT